MKFLSIVLPTSLRSTLDKQDQPQIAATSRVGGMSGFATDKQDNGEKNKKYCGIS
ncbi:MAG: hypothetical protein PHG59_02660 [Patescibacteria group bacterium]|nr:hypothetical protein [Patescibacteria group bacterium]